MKSTDHLKKITEDAERVLKSLRYIDPACDDPASRAAQEVLEQSQHMDELVFGSSGTLAAAKDVFLEQEHVRQFALRYCSLSEIAGVLEPFRSMAERYCLPEVSRTEELILRYRESALSDIVFSINIRTLVMRRYFVPIRISCLEA